MSPLRFFLYVLFSFIALGGLVLVFAWFQNFMESDLDDSPPEPPAGDVPRVPR